MTSNEEAGATKLEAPRSIAVLFRAENKRVMKIRLVSMEEKRRLGVTYHGRHTSTARRFTSGKLRKCEAVRHVSQCKRQQLRRPADEVAR